MTAKTAAERNKQMRANRIAAGLISVRVWAHPADKTAIEAVAKDLQQQRKEKHA